MLPSDMPALFNFFYLVVGLAIIYWYANKMLVALAKSTRYVRVPIPYPAKTTKQVSREEQLAVIDKIHNSITPHLNPLDLHRHYKEIMIDLIPKPFEVLKDYSYLPIRGKELDDLLETKFKTFVSNR